MIVGILLLLAGIFALIPQVDTRLSWLLIAIAGLLMAVVGRL